MGCASRVPIQISVPNFESSILEIVGFVPNAIWSNSFSEVACSDKEKEPVDFRHEFRRPISYEPRISAK